MSGVVSKRIIELLEAIEREGYVTGDYQIDGLARRKVSKILQRLVVRKLLEADKSDSPTRYSVSEDWRELVKYKEPKKALSMQRVTSVWQLGAMA